MEPRRLDPTISINDVGWAKCYDKFNSLFNGSETALSNILLKYFSPHEADLFFQQDHKDIKDIQAQNTQRYRQLIVGRFKGAPDNVATKLTMMYFGLPVEPISGSLRPAETMSKLKAEVGELKPLFFLENDELGRVSTVAKAASKPAHPDAMDIDPDSLQAKDHSRDVPVISKSVLTVLEQANLLRSYKSLTDIALKRAFPCPFDGCDFVFSLHDKDAAKCHILRFHMSKKCIWCDETHFEWWNETQRQQHLRQQHRDKLLLTLGLTDLKLVASTSSETVTVALTRVDLSGAGTAADRANGKNLANFINGPARQLIEFFCTGCGRDVRNFASVYEKEYHGRTCRGRSGDGGRHDGDNDRQQRTFCAECGYYTAVDGVDDGGAGEAGCGHELTTDPGQGRYCVLCGIDAERLGEPLAGMHRASCRGTGSACRPFCAYCSHRLWSEDDDNEVGDRRKFVDAHRCDMTSRPQAVTTNMVQPEASRKRLSPVMESPDEALPVEAAPAPAPTPVHVHVPAPPVISPVVANARKTQARPAAEMESFEPSSPETSVVLSCSSDEYRPMSTLSSNDMVLEQGTMTRRNGKKRGGGARKSKEGRDKGDEEDKDGKAEDKEEEEEEEEEAVELVESNPLRRAESPDWTSLLGPGDDSFVPDNGFYCSKCLRRVPKVGGRRRKSQGDTEVEVEKEYELHLATDRCCGIRNGVGSADGLPNRSGWIPVNKMPRLGLLKAAFIEAHPAYKATIFPLLPSDVRNNVWRSDPNNRGNQAAWTLPWPPYYAGWSRVEEVEEVEEAEEADEEEEEEPETGLFVGTGSVFAPSGVSSISAPSLQKTKRARRRNAAEEEEDEEEEPETISTGDSGSIFTPAGASTLSSSLNKTKRARRKRAEGSVEEGEVEESEEEPETESCGTSGGSLFTLTGMSSLSSSAFKKKKKTRRSDETEEELEDEPETASYGTGGSLFTPGTGASTPLWPEKAVRTKRGKKKRRIRSTDTDGTYSYETDTKSAERSFRQYKAEEDDDKKSGGEDNNDDDDDEYADDEYDEKESGATAGGRGGGGGERGRKRGRRGRRRQTKTGEEEGSSYRPRGEESDSDQELAGGPERVRLVREEMEQEIRSIERKCESSIGSNGNGGSKEEAGSG